MTERFDIAIAGGGIIGAATALALTEPPGRTVIILEAEDRLAAHQSSHNSGVIHAGLYYKPGSLKARLCTDGREAMYRFCAEHTIRHEQCGKVVVATSEEELARLDDLHQRGLANGLEGLRRLTPEELRDREPHAAGLAALLVPQTGIVDFAQVTVAMAKVVEERGGVVRCAMPVSRARHSGAGIVVETPAGEIECGRLIACAGLQADRVARRCGVRTNVRIIPFRGEYVQLAAGARSLVQHLIYPVPDPALPFLGVHFTRTIDGAIEIGPNALLSMARNGYRRGAFSWRDAAEMLRFRGFWRMGLRHWRTARSERKRSRRPELMLRDLQWLVPEVKADDLEPGRCGVRAMAVDPSGAMLDDFHIVQTGRMVHVLNAPSPAATASLAIGRHIAAMIE